MLNREQCYDEPCVIETHSLFFHPKEPPERRRGRRPRVDPAMLDPTKLTGEENVSVINRLTGKKVDNYI